MKLEYVASGLSLTRLCTGPFNKSERLIALANDAIKQLQNKDNLHVLSGLYNAYAEKGYGEMLENYCDSFYQIHADSGGLQIVTQGKTITPDIKKQVYTNQGSWADIGMSFDEMPLSIMDGKADRLDMSSRKFVLDMVVPKGRESGKNVRTQIETYLDMGSNCKPMIICQGNRIEDFLQYFDSIMSEVPEEYYSHIGGVALAGSCVGVGTLEAIDSVIAYTQMNIPDEFKNKVHLLGYGSLSRLMPILMLLRSGFVSNQTQISYDSTTHTSKYFMGGFYSSDHTMIDFGKTHNPKSVRMCNEVYDTFGDALRNHFDNISLEDYVRITNRDLFSSKKFNTGSEFDILLNEAAVFLTALTSIANFMGTITEFVTGDHIQFFKQKKIRPLMYLDSVKTIEDINHWKRQFSRYIDTNRVGIIDSVNSVNSNYLMQLMG